MSKYIQNLYIANNETFWKKMKHLRNWRELSPWDGKQYYKDTNSLKSIWLNSVLTKIPGGLFL